MNQSTGEASTTWLEPMSKSVCSKNLVIARSLRHLPHLHMGNGTWLVSITDLQSRTQLLPIGIQMDDCNSTRLNRSPITRTEP